MTLPQIEHVVYVMLEDIPAAIQRHIALTAKSLDEVSQMAEQWRANQGAQI